MERIYRWFGRIKRRAANNNRWELSSFTCHSYIPYKQRRLDINQDLLSKYPKYSLALSINKIIHWGWGWRPWISTFMCRQTARLKISINPLFAPFTVWSKLINALALRLLLARIVYYWLNIKALCPSWKLKKENQLREKRIGFNMRAYSHLNCRLGEYIYLHLHNIEAEKSLK